MKKLLLVLLLVCLTLAGCVAANTQTSEANPVTPTSPAPEAAPPPTMNAIQQAIATQKAIIDSRPTVTPIALRNGIPMPPDSLRVASPNGTNEVLFGLIDGVPSLECVLLL